MTTKWLKWVELFEQNTISITYNRNHNDDPKWFDMIRCKSKNNCAFAKMKLKRWLENSWAEFFKLCLKRSFIAQISSKIYLLM